MLGASERMGTVYFVPSFVATYSALNPPGSVERWLLLSPLLLVALLGIQ